MNLKALREAVSLALYIFADFIKNKGAASWPARVYKKIV